mmetsp:Transcript_31028/g.43486  ORF Transcript_31028/g.43486 Transcript_31028/m.43486 type:complete len:80 (+) Transcript_31028:80-319(+)|eukprot:jgi/Bigna1/61289/fgenesh1_kg.20_\
MATKITTATMTGRKENGAGKNVKRFERSRTKPELENPDEEQASALPPIVMPVALPKLRRKKTTEDMSRLLLKSRNDEDN